MFYKCLECGNIFESGEEKVHYERLHPDYPICEEFRSCPACGGEYEEAVQCHGCGSYFLCKELKSSCFLVIFPSYQGCISLC